MVSTQNLKTIILAGTTAVGKSSLAMELALQAQSQLNRKIEIINADTVSFYREFDIGSAKPSTAEQAIVPHHLIDRVTPLETFHAGDFLKEVEGLIQEIRGRSAIPLIVGGSGFYLKALRYGLWDAPATSPGFRASLDEITSAQLHQQLQELDSEHAKKVSVEDRYRIVRALEILHISGRRPSELQKEMNPEPKPEFNLWVLEREPVDLRTRIRARIESMLNQGWIDEVIRLRDYFPTSRMLHAVGYQQVLDFLNGDEPEGRKVEPGIPGLINEIDLAHRQLAKSQRTWLKNLKPDATYILPGDGPKLIDRFLQNHC